MLPNQYSFPLLASLTLNAFGAAYAGFRFLNSGKEWRSVQSPAPASNGETEIEGLRRELQELKGVEGELRSAKCAAESANLAKSRFMVKMSRELRTPLNGLLGMTQLAIETGESAEQKELLDGIATSAQSLVAVIDNIGEFSTLETTRLLLASEGFSVRQLANSIVNSALPAGRKKKLKFEVYVSQEVAPLFLGDVRYVREIVWGLFENAIKFTEAGEAGIRIEAAGSTALAQLLSIAVYDTGIGIPAEKQRTIFEPLAQTDYLDTRRIGDSGIGLPAVRNLAEALGGQISVRSFPGKGSTFTVTIPLYVVPEIPSRAAA